MVGIKSNGLNKSVRVHQSFGWLLWKLWKNNEEKQARTN